ncbi:acyl-CoA dehydrogenase family protein [Streptomyces sp. NBC_00400]|uniref:acyl-CoA dehydrogenase family protein n=1 Tax=Streptomyces sp. NBC_00400 TaxID=2975737 RepID=UPI002E20FB63
MPAKPSATSPVPSAVPPFDPGDPLGLDDLLTDEDRAVRDTVRGWAAGRVLPHIADWYERGELPGIRELARELGSLGALGMSLTGYGCAGTSAVQYGLACLELEAADSGIRSLVSVQGSLAMYAIWRFGSEEQKQQWLPRMAAGEIIGCFGLTEPDVGSDPAAMRTHAKREGGSGGDWVLNGRKMWITNGSVAGVAVVWARTDDGIRGFLVPTDTPGFSAPEIKHKWSLRASVTSELVLDDVRLPADAVLPEVTGLRGPLGCLSHARYGIIWGSMGAARTSFEAALDYATTREQFGRPIGGFQLTQAKLADMAVELHKGILLAHHLGLRMDAGRLRPEQISFGKLNNVREAIEICRTARTILGANGISLEYPVMRHATNLESVLTYEGTVEMHQLVLGKALTGLDAFR